VSSAAFAIHYSILIILWIVQCTIYSISRKPKYCFGVNLIYPLNPLNNLNPLNFMNQYFF